MTETNEQQPTSSGQEEPTYGNAFVAYFARNPVAANLLMVFMIVGGAAAAARLTAEVFPAVDPNMVTVSVPYPGATPTEVDESIAKRVNQAVMGIDGIKRVVSQAMENYGLVMIELKDFVDSKDVRDDIQRAVDGISDFPPEDAEEAEIVLAKPVSNVMTLVITSELPEADLRKGARAVEADILNLPGVSLVTLNGARDYEISVEVSERSLRRFAITIDEVANAIRRASINLSSGELRTDSGDVLLRTNQKREVGDEFGSIVVRGRPDGTAIVLRDVATIRDDFVDTDLISQFDGKNALFLVVDRSEGEDALEISETIRDFLSTYETPPGVDVFVWQDQTVFLESRVNLLLRNGVLGFCLVFLFLVVMLDLRLATWVAMGVPISFFGAFLFFDLMDVSINMVSMFALIIVLGVVVDDAVIVGENIGSEQERGLRGVHASVVGALGVAPPVIIGVLTTMTAFAPLLFVTGTMGQILGVVPVVVITVLTMSLLEVFCILPAHLAHLGRWSRAPLTQVQDWAAALLRRFRDRYVVVGITAAIRHRYLTLAYGVAFVLLCSLLMVSGSVRFLFFPEIEGTEISARVEYPVGTSFSITKDGAELLRRGAITVNQATDNTAFRSINVTIGGQQRSAQGPDGSAGLDLASHVASIRLELHPEEIRSLSAVDLSRMWREAVGAVPGAEVLEFSSQVFADAAEAEYDLYGEDQELLMDAIDWFEDRMREYPEISTVSTSVKQGKQQYEIQLTEAGVAAGLTQADISRQLRQSFFGEEVQRIQRGRDELKVMVRYPEAERRTHDDLFKARIRLADGSEVPLQTVAAVASSHSYQTIDRVNSLRQLSIKGTINTAMVTPTEFAAKLEAEVIPQIRSNFRGIQVGQAGFGLEMSEDVAALGGLALVAVLGIFVLLASVLRSYTQPLIILVAIPFGTSGALIGHFLLGYNLSMISIFGMIALSGVVVNDSLVLMDRYNIIRRTTALSVPAAIVSATRRRFRAIILTTVTTALGLTPMLFETSTQARFLVPMAISLATGIVFASVMILFVVPALGHDP